MLKPLADIKAPDLIQFDRQSYVDEIIERIKLNPEWSSVWIDELYQNADQMTMQLFAYMAEKNALNFNLNIRDKFLAHAFSEEAIFNNLSDMGVDVQQAKNSQVDVEVSLSDTIIRNPIVFDKYHKILATNINNSSIAFEIIEKDENNKYKYLDNVIINPDFSSLEHFTVTAYAGVTKMEEFEISEYTLENLQFTLTGRDVEDGSIRVYFNDPDGRLLELEEVDILKGVGSKNLYFEKGSPLYKIKYNKDNQPIIMFGTEEFGGAFENKHANGKIIVFYRLAYGIAGNILTGGINNSQTIKVLDKEYTLNFYNSAPSSGGKNIEDLQTARIYGPLRVGRNSAFIDEQDAQFALKNVVVKYKIDTPKMGIQNGVPFLHAIHYFVPNRSFDNFKFEDFSDKETISSYALKIINNFTSYCEISGAHDKAIKDEYVCDFVYPDSNGKIYFTHLLKNQSPTSGTLRATAYDEDGKILDYIRWGGNYILNPKVVAAEHDKVTRIRSNTFATLNIIDTLTSGNSGGSDNGKNNKLIIEFDDYDHIFDLTLPLGSRTYKELAAIINDLIVNEIKGQYSTVKEGITQGAVTNMVHLVNHVFCSYEVVDSVNKTGRLIFNSTKTGRRSKIKFHDYFINNTNTNYDLYYQLGVGVYTYRPGRETGWVFNDGMVFNYETNQIFFDIFSDNISKQQLVQKDSYQDKLVQSVVKEEGPTLSFLLTVENLVKEKLLIGADLNVYADKYNDVTKSFSPVSHMVFSNVIKDVNEPTLGVEDPRVNDSTAIGAFNVDSSSTYFDYDKSLVSVQFVNGKANPYYSTTYGEIHKITLKEVNVIPGNPVTFTTVEGGLSKIFYPNGQEWMQDPTSPTGVKFELSLSGLDLQPGKNYKLSLIMIDNSLIEHELDYVVFETFQNNQASASFVAIAYFNETPTEEVVSRILGSSQNGTYMNAVLKTIKVATKNPEEDPTLKTYSANWVNFDRIRFEYKSKNFDHITVTYTPNPYQPESEAKGLLDIVKDPGNRLIGLENITKNLKYIPFGVSIAIVVSKKYSLKDAVNAVRQTMYSNFSYNNISFVHDINYKPTAQNIKNLISEIATQYGIISISVNPTIDEYIATHYKEPCYFFIMEEALYQSLLELETGSSLSSIHTISDNYKISISANFGD